MFSSKPTSRIVQRARPPTLAGEVQTQPAAGIRGQTAEDNLRLQVSNDGNIGLMSPGGSTNRQDAAGSQSYAQWAGFTAGAPDAELGHGAYFEDKASAAKYTWTPSRRG